MMLSILTIITVIINCVYVETSWWETSAFYQIYPRSFKDSDGDGIGDLKGVTDKLQYLQDIGINATWLSPIFKSPMADFGYDISNFYEIQDEYGTMTDLEEMIEKANELNIKIILDFVPNHTSDEHEWFQNSINKVAGYEDFYVWHPGYTNLSNTNERLPPSNWISTSPGPNNSAWTWNEIRQEFYYHQFAVKQPDLNFRNDKVVEAMKDVLTFWMTKGVYGFRIDAIPHLFEVDVNSTGGYPDEPILVTPPLEYASLNHLYTRDQNETIDMVYSWRKLLDDFETANGGENRVIMTEAYSSIDIVMKYYGSETQSGAHIPFNFNLMALNTGSNANDFNSTISEWFENMPTGKTANWVIGNHDNRRVATRYGNDRIDIMSIIVQALPGASVTYYGEEIGMTDVWVSWNDTVDPPACLTNSSVYESNSRDPERTPFQWDSSVNGGFSTSNKTWLPVSPNYTDVNVETELLATKSYLKIYMELLKLRQTNTFKNGNLTTKALSDNVLGILRSLDNENTYIIIVNLGRQSETANLTLFGSIPQYLTFAVVGLNSQYSFGDQVDSSSVLTLLPSESFVLKGSSNLIKNNALLLVLLILFNALF